MHCGCRGLTRDHLLGDGDEVVIVGVRHVELARRELWVVCHVDAFIAELTTNLVQTVDTPNDQHLQTISVITNSCIPSVAPSVMT